MTHELDRFTADDGEPIHVRIRGTGGRPVVFLHGWTADHRCWAHWAEALVGECASYAWDARGHGGHALRMATAPTVQRMAADLQALIAHYGLERPVLVGHSMGALTVWEYLRRYGDAGLGGLGLIDQSPKLVTDVGWRLGIRGDFDAAANQRLIARLREDFAEGVLELAAHGLNRHMRSRYAAAPQSYDRLRAQLRALEPAPLIACWQSLAAGDWREVLPMIRVPTLLVYGTESQFYGPEVARWVHAGIAGSRLEVYAGADHSPQFWQRDRFLTELRALLAAIAA